MEQPRLQGGYVGLQVGRREAVSGTFTRRHSRDRKRVPPAENDRAGGALARRQRLAPCRGRDNLPLRKTQSVTAQRGQWPPHCSGQSSRSTSLLQKNRWEGTGCPPNPWGGQSILIPLLA